MHVLSAPLGQYLLTQDCNEILGISISCQLAVLLGVLKAHLNSIVDWSTHR